jgi:hypothetical protein
MIIVILDLRPRNEENELGQKQKKRGFYFKMKIGGGQQSLGGGEERKEENMPRIPCHRSPPGADHNQSS